jgi:adenosylcobinamide kinase/adenosylcobinamide-phosphate guanylyltransferase
LAAESGQPVLYVATMVVADEEMRLRVEEHRRRRPAAWRTLETPRGVAKAVVASGCAKGLVLVEDLALLVSNALLEAGDKAPSADDLAGVTRAIATEMDDLYALPMPTIVVSNEVGSGVVPAYPLGRAFRDLLGIANQDVAARADRVYWMVAGIPVVVKGG